MKLIEISENHPLWNDAWNLYVESFPEHERRSESTHFCATGDGRFHTHAAVDDDKLLALMFFWKNEGIIFLEHLAVVPSMRGKNIGSAVLQELLSHTSARGPSRPSQARTIVLEVDPPVDPVSLRRIGFYQRHGFQTNPYAYIHPSYQKGGKAHPLVIMSYPAVLSEGAYRDFLRFMNGSAYRYRDLAMEKV